MSTEEIIKIKETIQDNLNSDAIIDLAIDLLNQLPVTIKVMYYSWYNLFEEIEVYYIIDRLIEWLKDNEITNTDGSSIKSSDIDEDIISDIFYNISFFDDLFLQGANKGSLGYDLTMYNWSERYAGIFDSVIYENIDKDKLWNKLWQVYIAALREDKIKSVLE